ncbi:thiamine phosphate synthase [Mesobacillus foraminis]
MMVDLREYLKVYFIMGSVNCKKNPAEVLREAIDGGITIFQYREKGEGALEGKQKLELAKELRKICLESQIPFIVNDDIELALDVDADGVHIGQEDESAAEVRSKIGNKFLGVSVHTLPEAEAAIQNGADYFGVGPIYPTSTKADAKPVRGVTFLQELRSHGCQVPIVGIGGITAKNADAVTRAGADGVSVISAITHAGDVRAEADKISKAVYRGIEERSTADR